MVDRATRIEIISPNGVRADAVLLAVDPRTDLALLKMPFALPTVKLMLDTPAVGTMPVQWGTVLVWELALVAVLSLQQAAKI